MTSDNWQHINAAYTIIYQLIQYTQPNTMKGRLCLMTTFCPCEWRFACRTFPCNTCSTSALHAAYSFLVFYDKLFFLFHVPLRQLFHPSVLKYKAYVIRLTHHLHLYLKTSVWIHGLTHYCTVVMIQIITSILLCGQCVLPLKRTLLHVFHVFP